MREVMIAIAGVLLTVSGVSAHEGHAPLPTKGAALDPATGILRLSRTARIALGLETVEVQTRQITQSSFAYARLEAPWNRRAMVSSLLPGRIVHLYARPGESVAQGQALAEIDSQPLQVLRMELLSAQNDAALSRTLVSQLRPVAKSGAIPAQRLLEAESKLKQEESTLDIAKRQWQSLDLPADRLERLLSGQDSKPLVLTVRSPIAGTIVHADLSVGKIIDPKEHLFEIVDTSTVWIQIDVLEKDLRDVSLGQTVELSLTAYPGRVWQATVDRLSRFLDPVTHLGRAWATVHNPSGEPALLLPGMTGQVRLRRSAENQRLAVPISAVLRDGAERYVLVETASTKEGSEFKKQSVILGRSMDDHVELQGDAILPGDRIVTTGSHELSSFYMKGSLHLSPETAKDLGLELQQVGPRMIAEVFEVDGIVDVPPDRRSVVASPLSGVISKILVDRNQNVRAGEVIAVIRSLELQTLQLELLKSRVEVQLQQEVVNNLQIAAEGVSRRRLLEVDAALQAARIRQQGIEAQLRSLGLSEGDLDSLTDKAGLLTALPIRAPIDGVVVQFDKLLGHVVRADEPLFEIQDLSRSYIQAFLSEQDAGKVAIGQSARLRFVARPDEVLVGTVARTSPELGDTSRTLPVWIEVNADNEAILPHNALTRISVGSAEYSASLAIPRTALLREGSRTYIFLQQKNGAFQRRVVTTGRSDDQFVEILSGVAAGEIVAVRGVSRLQTGYSAIR